MAAGKELVMIGQCISDRVFEIDDCQQAPAAAPRFQARMSLIEARATLLAATRALSVGGFTCRAGMATREVCAARPGKYRPVEILNWLRGGDFAERFQKVIEDWKITWRHASPAATHVRESQYRACLAFIAEKGWQKLADAIESMLAARAQQVVVEDEAGNRRVQSLIDVLDLFFGIPMTAARAARMKVVCGE